MPHTPTLENPFAPEKHRSADDPALIGKILGADAEAAMRKTVPSPGRSGEGEVGDELTLTPEEQRQAEERKRRKQEQPWIYAQVVTWAEDIGKDEQWVEETFTFQSDGSLIVLGNFNIGTTPCDRLPHGLKEVHGNLVLDGLTSAEHLALPSSIGGSLYLDGLTSAEHLTLPNTIGGHLFLDGLPDAEKEKLRKERPDLKIH